MRKKKKGRKQGIRQNHTPERKRRLKEKNSLETLYRRLHKEKRV